MILQALNQLYDRLADDAEYEISRPGFSLQKIAFAIVLRPDGSVVDIIDVRIQPPEIEGKKAKGKPQPNPMQVFGGNKPSGSGLNPTLLWDTKEYLLGFRGVDDDDKKFQRTRQCFQAAGQFHAAREAEFNHPAYSAVCRFFASWQPEQCANYPFLGTLIGGYGVFKLSGEPGYIHDMPELRERYLAALETAADPEEWCAQSLISGRHTPIARLQGAIKGIGAKPAPLAGFNAPAYESYGKEQAYNAPVGKDEEFRYTVALNALTDGPKKGQHTFAIGDMKVVFWTEKPGPMESAFPFICGVAEPDKVQDETVRDRLAQIFAAFRQGKMPAGDLGFQPDDRFYVLGLTTNVTRLVIRFFYESTVGAMLENFRKHYAGMRLVKSDRDPEFPSVRQILDQTCPLKGAFPDRDKLPANLQGQLLRSILSGTPYPTAVYNQILRRFQLDHYQDYIKAAFIQGFLIRNHRKEFIMNVDPNNKNPGYLCGCIFAVLEKVQEEALGKKLNRTIRDSYFGAASCYPGRIFPRLLRLYQNHLRSIDDINLRKYYDRFMQNIQIRCQDVYPPKLTYEDQGAFCLGYYKQKADFYIPKSQRIADNSSSNNVDEQ